MRGRKRETECEMKAVGNRMTFSRHGNLEKCLTRESSKLNNEKVSRVEQVHPRFELLLDKRQPVCRVSGEIVARKTDLQILASISFRIPLN